MPLVPVVLAVSLVSHEPPTGSLDVQLVEPMPASCGFEGLPEAVEHLGIDATTSVVRVRVAIEQRGAVFRETLEITVDGAPPEARVFEAEHCLELMRATALLLAIALEPVELAAGIEGAAPGRDPEASVPDVDAVMPPPALVIEESTTSTPSPPSSGDAPLDPSPRWHLASEAMVGPTWGSLPGTAPMMSAGLDLEHRRRDAFGARLGLVGRYAAPTEAAYPSSPTLSARFDRWAINARACLGPGTQRWTLAICAGLEAGRLRARASGTADARTEASLWVAGVTQVSIRVRIRRRLRLLAGVELGVPFVRERFHFEEFVEPQRELHAVDPTTLHPWLGVGVQLF